ncbi:late histone H2B.L4-like [Ovis aries]|uniref:Uncharacterized protein n=1 Tax=Ovis aries TaxID=9940 RepID=A0AC11DZR8_SHEEP|nr:late histone H2B.L4-like [Ovis aries]
MAQPSSDNSEEDLGTNKAGTSKTEPSEMEFSETETSETEPSDTETSETEPSEPEPSEPEPYDAEPKKAKQKTAKGRRRLRRRHLDNFASFATYFPRVLRQVHTGLSLSHEAMNVMDSFVKDMFEQIAEEAGSLARSNKHCTITSGEIQTAVSLLLPGEIGKYAVSEATKSVIRYNTRR